MRILALSGGKDSMACLFLLRKSIDCAIYVDTGKGYPETADMIRYAETIVPVVTVKTDRDEQNSREGIPAEVVPIDWTTTGQALTGEKPYKIQSYLQCHFENIACPLFMKAKEMEATHLIYGQRNEDSHKSPMRHGEMSGGMTRLHPIEDWTSQQVLDYLATQMEIPAHFFIKHSSLDCYDCPAFGAHDQMAFTKAKYPAYYGEYRNRMDLIKHALLSSGYMDMGERTC